MASHHDHFFQVAFGEPEHAVPLLRTALPAPVADAIDWRTLTRQDPTQRGRRGRRTLCDLLFEVRTVQQQDLLLYVVLEHKSQGRRFDALAAGFGSFREDAVDVVLADPSVLMRVAGEGR